MTEIGDRFLYVSNHNLAAELTGKPCTLVEIYDESIQWPYAVKFDDGATTVAIDRELSPIAADGSVGSPLLPPEGSRKGWNTYGAMLRHSHNKIVAVMDATEDAI